MRRPPAAVRAGFDRLLSRGPWQHACRRRARRQLLVLAYHGVTDPVRFGRQLDHIQATASPVSLAEVAASARAGADLPPHAVLVTFDDGERSVLEHALPALQARGIPAVAFVVTDSIGTDLPHWWAEVEHLVAAGGQTRSLPGSPNPAAAVRSLKLVPDVERRAALDELRTTASAPAPRTRQLTADDLIALERGGVSIGSHTASHPCLHRCTTEVIEAEVSGAYERLKALLGHPPTAFAYPNGDHDPRVRRAVERAGHEVAFAFDHRVSAVPPPDPLRIARVRADASASPERFASLLSGLHPALHHLLRRP